MKGFRVYIQITRFIMFGIKLFSWIILSYYVLFDYRFGYLMMDFYAN
jgi:hypothetical protein